MAEMSTLLGYEIVDKKARELIANLGGGGTGDNTSEMFRTVQKDYRYAMENGSVAGADFEGFIYGSPVVGMKIYGYTEVEEFTSEETLYNPRTIPNSSITSLRYYLGSGNNYTNGYLNLPFDSPTFFGGFSIKNESSVKSYLRSSDDKCKCNKVIRDYKDKYWVSDEVNFESGKYYKRTHSITYDGSADENWEKLYPDNPDNWLYRINLGRYPATEYAGNCICDRLPSGTKLMESTTPTAVTPKELEYVLCNTNYAGSELWINIGYYMTENTVDGLRNILSQYPITICYPLYWAEEIDITDENTLEKYRKIRLTNKPGDLDISAFAGTIVEVSYPITEAGAALALGARETSVAKYETQLDRLYKHFKYDRSVRPYCAIAIPKSSRYISGGFYLFFYDNKLVEKDASWGKQVFCSYGIYNATLTSLPDDFNNIEKVVDFVTDNFSSSDVKYSGLWHTIDTDRYYYYANYKTSSFPTIELDIPFDGDIKFPKISDMDITHGSKGQLLTTEGNGAISFVSLPPVASYEDRLYEHFKISKSEYPYVYVTITFTGNRDKYVIFTDGIELTDWTADEPPKYTITGRHKFAIIPVLAGLSDEVCRDLESVTNYIINNMAPIDLNGVFNPGTSILSECFANDGYHYVTINKPAGTYSNIFDLRQLPLLTADKGARFKSTVKSGRVTGDYGTAGQYMITNGDGTVSFADGAGSGTDIIVPTKVSELENDAGYITADDLPEAATDEQVQTAVESYLSENPIESGNDYGPTVKAVNHRGYSAGAPENTLPAYVLSKKKGFKYAECDVAFTSDGVAVLLHDDTIDRTSNGSGSISSLTYNQVSSYDFGSWFSAEYAGTKIPTFKEFIELCKNIDLHPYIELKSSGDYTQEQITGIVDAVKAAGMKGKVTYISFNSDFLGYVKATDPSARLGYLSSTIGNSVLTTVTSLRSGSNEVYASINHTSLTDAFISDCIAANIPLEIWTVNDAEYIRNMNGYISGVTSDSLIAGDILRSEYIDSVGTIGFPTDENGTANHGVAGQFLVSNGDGTVSWVSLETAEGGGY